MGSISRHPIQSLPLLFVDQSAKQLIGVKRSPGGDNPLSIVPLVPLPQVIHLVETNYLSVLKLADNDTRSYALLFSKPDHL